MTVGFNLALLKDNLGNNPRFSFIFVTRIIIFHEIKVNTDFFNVRFINMQFRLRDPMFEELPKYITCM